MFISVVTEIQPRASGEVANAERVTKNAYRWCSTACPSTPEGTGKRSMECRYKVYGATTSVKEGEISYQNAEGRRKVTGIKWEVCQQGCVEGKKASKRQA